MWADEDIIRIICMKKFINRRRKPTSCTYVFINVTNGNFENWRPNQNAQRSDRSRKIGDRLVSYASVLNFLWT
jgi:hypothetical protein